MTDEEITRRFENLRRQNERILDRLQENNKVMATLGTQIIGAGEAAHILMKRVELTADRFDSLVDGAEEDSKKTGANQIQVTSKQETLLDIQIKNALADSAAKTRTQIKDYLQIFLSIAAAIVIILGLIKVYVHLP